MTASDVIDDRDRRDSTIRLGAMNELAEKVLAAKDVTELFDVLANAIGAGAYGHFEKLVEAAHHRDIRNEQHDMAPWTELDLNLLKRLRKAAVLFPETCDPLKPGQRLDGIIEQMEALKVRAERGW